MQRRLEQARLVGHLDDAAEIHHRDAVADVLDHREVVRDEQIRQLQFVLQIHQQVDDLRLDRDVERGDRLVADDQVRVERQRAGDADALALPAGEFVGIGLHRLRPQSDSLEQMRHPVAPLGGGADSMDCQRLADDLAGRHARIQRSVRVLVDHLHALAVRQHVGRFEPGDVGAVDGDLAVGRFEQFQHRAPDRGLAAAALADQTQGLAAIDAERTPSTA